MRRVSRDINVFNMSMLDVICSALGAFLILYLQAAQAQQSAEANAKSKEKIIEDLEEKLRKAQLPQGVAIGTCETTASKVKLSLWDSGGAVDGDHVKLRFNQKLIEQKLSLPGPGATYSTEISLEMGANYIEATALDGGKTPPNTAGVRVDPCQKQRYQDFQWEMDAGEVRHISIVRKP